MEDKANRQLEGLKRQNDELTREMDALQAGLQKTQARISEVGQMLAAVHGGIVALEFVLSKTLPEASPQPVAQG